MVRLLLNIRNHSKFHGRVEKQIMKTELLISAAVALLLGVVFVGIISDEINGNTALVSGTQTFDLTDARAPSYTIVDELNAWLNTTNYTLANFTAGWNITSITVVNASNSVVLLAGNYTFNETTGVLSNATTNEFTNVSVTYSWNNPTWLNNTYPFYLSYIDSSTTPSAWREEISACSKGTLIDSNLIDAYNSTGDALTMNGCDTGEFYLINDVNEIYFCNNVGVNESATATVTYKYCSDDYVSGWAGTTLNMTTGFFALAILAVAIWLVYMLFGRNFDFS